MEEMEMMIRMTGLVGGGGIWRVVAALNARLERSTRRISLNLLNGS